MRNPIQKQKVQREGHEHDLFKIFRFRSVDEVLHCIQQYEEETFTHFIKYNRDKNFGNEEFIPNVEGGRICYQSHCGKANVPIEYDGVPFMHIGRWALVCHQGSDLNKQHKQKYQRLKAVAAEETGTIVKSRQRSSSSKKVNCPAKIYVAHVMKFPQYKVSQALNSSNVAPTEYMRKVTKRKIVAHFRTNPQRLLRQSWYYVMLPNPSCHERHEVFNKAEEVPFLSDRSATFSNFTVHSSSSNGKTNRSTKPHKFRTKEPVDPRVLDCMYKLAKEGIHTVKAMQKAVQEFVKENIFSDSSHPPAIYRRYNPTSVDIQNAIYKVKQELKLERRRQLQMQCSSVVEDIAKLIFQTENDEYLEQLLQQLQHIYASVKGSIPVEEFSVGDAALSRKQPSESQTAAQTIEMEALSATEESEDITHHLHCLENQAKEALINHESVMLEESQSQVIHEISAQDEEPVAKLYYCYAT